jgi:ketosteroid isomerase-like protein
MLTGAFAAFMAVVGTLVGQRLMRASRPLRPELGSGRRLAPLMSLGVRPQTPRGTPTGPRQRRAITLRDTARTMPDESTTPDLVELTRRQFEFADRGDWDAILETYAHDAVWELRQGATFEGVDAIRELWVDYFSAYEEFEVETEEILDFGNGVILAVNKQKARLVGSASHIQTREAFLYTWERGVVVRVTMYTDIDEARAAAERLAEERAQADA